MAKYHINLNPGQSHASLEKSERRMAEREVISEVESLALSAGENIARMMIYGQRFGMLQNSDANTNARAAQVDGHRHSYLSDLGLPVWGAVTLSYPTLPDLVFDIVLIDVSMTRNIVTTALVGADGEVKEYISDKDFEVNLKCQIVGDGPDYYPQETVAAIQKMLTINDSLQVYSDIINNFGIQNIVIKNYNYTQDEGMRNVVQLNITALADNPENYYVIIQ
jgi:hypothetical protein